jgi:hypothetical protein
MTPRVTSSPETGASATTHWPSAEIVSSRVIGVGVIAGSGQYVTSAHTLVQYEVSGPITGGTGRFAGAAGTLAFLGTADLAAGTFTDDIFGPVTKQTASLY